MVARSILLRAVSRDDVIKLLEAARWAPSCFGDQPWRYLVWDRSGDAQAWQRAFDCLVEGNQKWARNAPLLMLSCADGAFAGNDKPNRWGQHDTGMASLSLTMQATELGLMVHQMGGFDDAKARAEFSIPEALYTDGHDRGGLSVSQSSGTGGDAGKGIRASESQGIGRIFFCGRLGSALRRLTSRHAWAIKRLTTPQSGGLRGR